MIEHLAKKFTAEVFNVHSLPKRHQAKICIALKIASSDFMLAAVLDGDNWFESITLNNKSAVVQSVNCASGDFTVYY